MKKIAILMLAAGMFSLVACGPSAEEKAAAEQRITDSIAAVDAARVQDSIAAADMAAQALIAAQKATEDSLKMVAMQDSLAAVTAKMDKMNKKASAPKPKAAPVVKPQDVKAGQGKG